MFHLLVDPCDGYTANGQILDAFDLQLPSSPIVIVLRVCALLSFLRPKGALYYLVYAWFESKELGW